MSSPLSGKDTLDQLLLAAIRYNVRCIPRAEVPATCYPVYGDRAVRIERFVFSCHAHDTGVGVRAWIVDDHGGALTIIDTHFWFSSSYCFNDSLWEHGAWDAALEDALVTIRSEVAVRKAEEEATENQVKRIAQEQEAARKSQFEALFIGQAS